MEVKGDGCFLLNEKPNKKVKFCAISQHMGIFQGLCLHKEALWGSGKWIMITAESCACCNCQTDFGRWVMLLIHHVFFYSHSVWKWYFSVTNSYHWPSASDCWIWTRNLTYPKRHSTQGAFRAGTQHIKLQFRLKHFSNLFEPGHEKTSLCHMRTTKAQISLHIRAVWSAPLLFAD